MSAQLEIVLTDGASNAALPDPVGYDSESPSRAVALSPELAALTGTPSIGDGTAEYITGFLEPRIEGLIDAIFQASYNNAVAINSTLTSLLLPAGDGGAMAVPASELAGNSTAAAFVTQSAALPPANDLPPVNSGAAQQAPSQTSVAGQSNVAAATAEAGLMSIGRVAAGAAMGLVGVGVAAVGAVKAITAIGQAGRAEAERLSGYSGALAGATAMAQVADMLRDIKRADRLGPQLAAFTMANSRLENAIGDLKNAFLEKTMPALTMAVDRVAETMKILELWAKEAEIAFDKATGNAAELRRDRLDLQRILQELEDIRRGLPPGGDPVTDLLMGMANDPANNPFGAPRRLPARAIP